VVRQAAIGFAEPRRTYTKSFERYVLELDFCISEFQDQLCPHFS
jgi:hypothetical protein